jgi:hypothetical protein
VIEWVKTGFGLKAGIIGLWIITREFTVTHASVHNHVFTGPCLVSAFNGGFFPSGFANCPQPQLRASHNDWTPAVIQLHCMHKLVLLITSLHEPHRKHRSTVTVPLHSCLSGYPPTAWLLNCCWTSPAQLFLVLNRTGLMTMFKVQVSYFTTGVIVWEWTESTPLSSRSKSNGVTWAIVIRNTRWVPQQPYLFRIVQSNRSSYFTGTVYVWVVWLRYEYQRAVVILYALNIYEPFHCGSCYQAMSCFQLRVRHIKLRGF